MVLKVAASAGFCHGVNRAVNMCREAAEKYDNCVTLGPVIHNRHVTGELAEKGVRVVTDISEITGNSTVIIRSHGIGREESEALKSIGADIVDATCPDVKKIHDIVRRDSEDGRFILVAGEKNHPEVSAICSWCRRYKVISVPDELEKWLCSADFDSNIPVSVVFQTTCTRSVYNDFTTIIKKECTNPIIYGTICNATKCRQDEAEKISKVADAVIIIGDINSSNSRRLAEICKVHCANVLFVQSADEIEPALFRGYSTVGITAGASTPAFIIKEVIGKMSIESRDSTEEIMDGIITEKDDAASAAQPETLPEQEAPVRAEISDEDSFEEMLEKSIKTLHTGDKVSGIVTSITATEISVDLGAKQSGYIPLSEFTDNENTDISELVKVGDTIEAFITRVNDVEGMIMLSKKRLDAIKNWDVVIAARDSREIVQGVVIQENRGGVVVNVKGVHVFVPASQTGLSKNEPMSDLLKKYVKLRINEVNQSRRRVIGSIRDAQKDERREKSEKLWNEIEVGKKYDGVVKSMTSYGVFVDIGGVDGMIHISELSWTRIKQPSEVLSVGDEISVYVISFDKESRKISLGYKKGEENPWIKFTSDYKVDDIVNVKIVKMMPFGAFAEICPGVDGLIHISQIAEQRIGLPSEVLSEGQTVDVKITEIDNDRKKVSLSIRALLEPAAEPAPEAAAGEPVTEAAESAEAAGSALEMPAAEAAEEEPAVAADEAAPPAEDESEPVSEKD